MKKILVILFVFIGMQQLSAQLTPYRDSATHLYGFKDTAGNIIVNPQYDMANFFSDGRAAVNKGAIVTNVNASGGKWGYIDTTGKIIIPLKYDFAQDFRKDTARVVKDRMKFLIDKNGKIIDQTKYYKITRFDTPVDWEKKN